MVIKIGEAKTGAQSVRLGDAARMARYTAEAKDAAERAERSAALAADAQQGAAEDARRAEAAREGGSTEVFMAKYGVTTQAELDAALQAGKQIYAQNNNTPPTVFTLDNAQFYISYFGEFSYMYTFSHFDGTTLNRIQFEEGRWITLADVTLASEGDVPSLTPYRTAAAQDEIDEAQDAEIAGVKSAIAPFYSYQLVNLGVGFEKGAISSAGNPTTGSTVYCRTTQFVDLRDKLYTITPAEGCRVAIAYYTAEDYASFDHVSDVYTTQFKPEQGYFAKIVVGKTNGNAISVAESYSSFMLYADVFNDPNNDIIQDLCEYTAESIPFTINNNAWVNARTGATQSNNDYVRTDFFSVEGFDKLVFSNVRIELYDSPLGLAFYSAKDPNTFISGEFCDVGYFAGMPRYTPKIVTVPDGAKYARTSLLKADAGFSLKGIKKKPLAGLYLSVLGDSMTAADSLLPNGTLLNSPSNYVPTGNELYYRANNADTTIVRNIRDMWWMRLCEETGMIPLVIDAWSGSAVCYNYSQTNNSRIPMCSTTRTGRLAKDGHDPDVIIIAGGANDWNFAANATSSLPATTPIGDWDGHTPVNPSAIDSGNSDFMQSYAYMIKRLQRNYPNAIIVCSTVWKSLGKGNLIPPEPTSTEDALTYLNDVGNTTMDYSRAIEKVCKIIGVPVINVSNIGITHENAWPDYAHDSQANPAHTTALGQAVIARRYIEELPRLVKQFKYT